MWRTNARLMQATEDMPAQAYLASLDASHLASLDRLASLDASHRRYACLMQATED